MPVRRTNTLWRIFLTYIERSHLLVCFFQLVFAENFRFLETKIFIMILVHDTSFPSRWFILCRCRDILQSRCFAPSFGLKAVYKRKWFQSIKPMANLSKSRKRVPDEEADDTLSKSAKTEKRYVERLLEEDERRVKTEKFAHIWTTRLRNQSMTAQKSTCNTFQPSNRSKKMFCLSGHDTYQTSGLHHRACALHALSRLAAKGRADRMSSLQTAGCLLVGDNILYLYFNKLSSYSYHNLVSCLIFFTTT